MLLLGYAALNVKSALLAPYEQHFVSMGHGAVYVFGKAVLSVLVGCGSLNVKSALLVLFEH